MEPITMGALIPAPLDLTIAAGPGVIAALAMALAPLAVALHHAFNRKKNGTDACPPETEGNRDWTAVAWPQPLRLLPRK